MNHIQSKMVKILRRKKARVSWYSVETMTDADYRDDLELLANTQAQAESLLHSLEQAAGGSVLYINAN